MSLKYYVSLEPYAVNYHVNLDYHVNLNFLDDVLSLNLFITKKVALKYHVSLEPYADLITMST